MTNVIKRNNGYAVSRDLNPIFISIDCLKQVGRETRKHPPSQIKKLAASLEQFGFVVPIVIDEANGIVAGLGMVQAAKRLGLAEVPAICIAGLDDSALRSLRLALNRLGEDSGWDREALALEFADIIEINSGIDLQISGFEMGELDTLLSGGGDEEDELPVVDLSAEPITKPGDVWQMGPHKFLCGDALSAQSYATLLGDERAQMGFTDPPYNIAIEDNVSGLGEVRHRDFAMACGEMTSAEFEAFLNKSLGLAAQHSIDGAVHMICMDWRHQRELAAAGAGIYSSQLNLCVWNKSNGGMGSLYRSKHELVFIFKVGTAPHINNVALGRHGRNRSNVWDYAGQNALRGSKSKLSLHPTAKPVALVADAIRDCSERLGIILDPFGGVGTTIIAAEKTGRVARLIELDPRYVDATVQRWQRLTGRSAVNAKTGEPFAQR